MKNILIILFVCVVGALGQLNWATRSRIRDHTEFYTQVIQETIYQIERRGFSSLTLTNVSQIVNERMYRMDVNGTANYTNGFLVSIQKIDITGMTQSVGMSTVDGVQIPRATVSGTLNLRDAKLGYDVIFYDINGVVHTFTGDFDFTLITWSISIHENLTTKEISVSLTTGTTGAAVRMVYRPPSSISEVISRQFRAFDTTAGVGTWSTIIEPSILDVIKNKIPFPDVCYSHC